MRNTNTLIAIVVIVVLAVLLFGGAGMMGFGGFGMMGPGMMGGYGSPYGFGYNPIGSILSLVFWALILGGVVLLVVWLLRSANWTSQASSPDSAIEILKARYAKGEITKEQFDAMKRDLQ